MQRPVLLGLWLVSLSGCTSTRVATDGEQIAWARRAANQAQRAALEAERHRDGALAAESSAWGSAADAAVARETLSATIAQDSFRTAAEASSTAARRAERRTLDANRSAAIARRAAQAAASPWPREYHVDEARAGMIQDGSESHPFPTIGPALRLAQRGDTILVGPATYEGSIALRPGVTLRGRSPGPRPLLQGTLTLATGCRVENIAVTSLAKSPRGIVGKDVYDVLLRGVVVRDLIEPSSGRGDVVGIDLVGCREVRIEDCQVRRLRETKWGGVWGIRLTSCQAKLIGNRVQDIHEDAWEGAWGILLIGCDAELSGNIVSDISETQWDAAYGIQLVRTRARVSFNTVVGIQGTAWRGAHGIHVNSSSQGVIEGNIVASVRGQESSTGIFNGSEQLVVRRNNVWAVSNTRSRNPAHPYAGPNGDANLHVAPLFVSRDYRLDPESPCRGAFRDVVANGLHLGAWGAPRASAGFPPD
jgi:hypothetical protein